MFQVSILFVIMFTAALLGFTGLSKGRDRASQTVCIISATLLCASLVFAKL